MGRVRLLAPMVICLAAVGIQAASYWDRLPEREATRHAPADDSGHLNTKETFFGFEMGLVFFTTGLFTLIASALPKARPEVFNIPNRAYWMAPERQRDTIGFIQRRLWVMAIVAGAFTIFISQLVLDNSMEGKRLNNGNLLGLVSIFAVLIAGFSISMAVRFARVPKAR